MMNRRSALKKSLLLGGTAAFSSSLLGLLQSCQSENTEVFHASFISLDHSDLIAGIVDHILPKTDTPGALDLKINAFIELAFDKLYDEEGKAEVVKNLDSLQQKLDERFHDKFSSLTTQQKNSFLKEEERKGGTFNSGVWGTAVGDQEPISFYKSLKSMAIWGYFSSEEIGKNVLNYDPIPGPYQGCIPLEDVGNSWSLG